MVSFVGLFPKRPTKETYKRDLQKRPTKETYMNILDLCRSLVCLFQRYQSVPMSLFYRSLLQVSFTGLFCRSLLQVSFAGLFYRSLLQVSFAGLFCMSLFTNVVYLYASELVFLFYSFLSYLQAISVGLFHI